MNNECSRQKISKLLTSVYEVFPTIN